MSFSLMRIFIEFENQPLLFQNPQRIISCREPEHLQEAFAAIEQALEQGYYVAGFVSYEAGYALEEKLASCFHVNFPLLVMGCYEAPVPFQGTRQQSNQPFDIRDVTHNISQENYFKDIDAIREYIRIGDVYQITYCFKLQFSFHGDAYSLYRRLLRAQSVPYPAYIEADDYKILSLSPEMFMKKNGSFIVTKPMKGSWPRMGNPFMDIFSGPRLKFSRKNRAENIMIADLMRNDLSRVANRVRAPRLFEVARYKTIYQMTSTVTASTPGDIPIYDLFKAVFPSGSVTGAPKIRAMEIIRSLEREDRKIYTGAIGFIAPNKDLFFNIPIRTILLQGNRGEMGIGGGIVWDSTPQGEWNEGLWKARFFTDISSKRDICRC